VHFYIKRNFTNQDKGVAAIEFAIILPVLLVILVGIFDITNLLFCYNKMNRVAQDISNIVTRGNLTKPQLDSILQSTPLIAQPFNFLQTGSNIIVTSVSTQNPNNQPQIMWQDSYPGGVGESRINPTSLPGGLVLNTNQTAIFTEVFFTYSPLIPGFLIPETTTNIYTLAAAFPRQGQMTTLPPS